MLVARQRNLGLFDLMRQPVTGPVFNQCEQAFQPFRLQRIDVKALLLGPDLPGVGEIDGVPGGQIEVNAGRHFAAIFQCTAITQLRHDAAQAQLAVEVGAANMHAAIGQHIVAPIRPFGPFWRQANDGKVGSATADVGNQHDFFAMNLRFVMIGGGNRLELKADFREADGAGNFAQRVLGLLVGRRVVVDKENRAPENGLFEGTIRRLLRPFFQGADELVQQFPEDDGLPIHLRAPVDQAAAEQALQRAHQPAFGAVQIFRQPGAAEADVVLFRVEKHHRGQRQLAILQRQQARCARSLPADGGVGRTEIDAASAGGRGKHGEAGQNVGGGCYLGRAAMSSAVRRRWFLPGWRRALAGF